MSDYPITDEREHQPECRVCKNLADRSTRVCVATNAQMFVVCADCMAKGLRVSEDGSQIWGRPQRVVDPERFDPRVWRTREMALRAPYVPEPDIEHRVYTYCVRVPLDTEANRGGSYVVLADSPDVANWVAMERGMLGKAAPVGVCSYIRGDNVPYPLVPRTAQALAQFPADCVSALLRVYFQGVERHIREED
jgi:hypothetical protein